MLKGISASLGLEENYIQKTLNVGSNSHQLLVINSYPACPQPELVMGLPPHSDHGLLTIIMQNDLGGLQVQHDGKWVPVNPPPGSFVVNVGDQLEVIILKSLLIETINQPPPPPHNYVIGNKYLVVLHIICYNFSN